MQHVLPPLLFILNAQSAGVPTRAQSKAMGGMAQIHKGQPLPHEWEKACRWDVQSQPGKWDCIAVLCWGRGRRCWWLPGGAGGYLGQSQWWDVISIWHHRVFCVGFRDYLWFQGKHNWKECRPRQLHVSWDSYTEKFFPFTLWSLRPGPDRALMKTMPKSQVHFSHWHMDVLFYLQTLTDNAEHM